MNLHSQAIETLLKLLLEVGQLLALILNLLERLQGQTAMQAA